jgi:hypothetical protein
MKIMIFCVVTPCSYERFRRLGGKYHLSLLGQNVRRTESQKKQAASSASTLLPVADGVQYGHHTNRRHRIVLNFNSLMSIKSI